MDKYLNSQIAKIDTSGIRKVFDLASKIKDPVNLSIGEPDFGFIPDVAKSLHEAIDSKCYKYTNTWGLSELRVAVAAKLKMTKKSDVLPEEVLITAGASGALDLLFRVITEPRDEIIIFDPYFMFYHELPRMLGANVIVLPTTKEFWPDIEALKKNINKKTKAVIINSPNNPTGAVYPERIIKDIIDVLDPYDTLLVSDEVYEDFIYDVGHVSPLCFYENTILVSSFSKNLALTGQRVGYAAGSRGVLMAMAKLQQYTYVCAPHLAQVAALQNLNLDISNYVSEYKERRDLIYDMLKDTFEIQKPEGAFYIYPKVGDGEKVALKSIEKDLIVVPGQVFSKSNEYLRISYAAPKDVLIKGANILKEVADELR